MSTPVAKTPDWLREEIASRGGFISVHDYMQVCLYHPEFGYYSRGDNFTEKFGKDFVTAPMLSPIFAATIARWIEKTWREIGRPSPFVLMEAGPGSGDLMLHVLKNLSDDIVAVCEVVMVEASAVLARLQQEKLRGKNVKWATEIAAQKHPVILIANELLDAFPVHQFEKQKGDWVERGFDAGLNAATRPAPVPAGAPEGMVESAPEMLAWVSRMKDAVSAALLIDYGYVEGRGDSVQAMFEHKPVSLTHAPGQSDLTAHVNFAQVASTLGAGVKVSDLAEFLLNNKILEAAEPTINDENTAAALHRLLHPTRMGALFKALEYRAE